MDIARATMVVAELASQQKVPSPIFQNQEKLRGDMWVVIWDRDIVIRGEGVRSLQAILRTLVIRADRPVAEAAMRDTMDVIRRTLSSSSDDNASNLAPCHQAEEDVSKVHGSLAMLASVLRAEETKAFMLAFSSELCSLALPYQSCKEPQVRQAVADILPLVVQLDRAEFANRFLDTVHESTLELVRDTKFPPEERGRSLISLAVIAEQMPSSVDITHLLTDMLQECRSSLRTELTDLPARIPQGDVISTISHIAKSPRCGDVLEKELRAGLLYGLFRTDFTNELVTALDIVGKAVPVFAEAVREKLVHLIAATLRKRLPKRMYGLATSEADLQDLSSEGVAAAGISHGSVSRTRSFLSLTAASANVSPPPRRARDDSVLLRGKPQRQDTSTEAEVQASARDFFRHAPVSDELHRIDSSTVLVFKSSIASLEGSVKGDRKILQSSDTFGVEGPPSLVPREEDRDVDKENSPCVALKAIVSYEFTGMTVMDFCCLANEFVMGYVEHNRMKVRALAVAASSKLMLAASRLSFGVTKELIPEINKTMTQFLAVAVTDPSTDVRFVAIRALDNEAFYPYLLQPEMLGRLFICFHDLNLAIRQSALTLAGHLIQENPAQVFPQLRRFFMHLMRVLRCDGDFFARDRREAAELVYVLVHTATDLVIPYTSSLVHALLIRLREAQQGNDTISALPVLLTIAEMGGTTTKIDLRPYEAEMGPLLVDSVLDAQGADASYRKAALRALSAFLQNTGFVRKPYVVHSALLPELLQLLKSETDPSVRLSAEVLLGSLGAVDPADNKYAAIADYYGRGHPFSERMPGNGSEGRSTFKRDPSGVTALWEAPARPFLRQGKAPGMVSSLLQDRRQAQPEPSRLPGEANSLRPDNASSSSSLKRNPEKRNQGERTTGTPNIEDADGALSIFGKGGTELSEKIAAYTPCWAADSFPRDSLIALLEHPFTSSPEYFPSVALDSLHRIIANPKLHLQHREACQAIVNILKSVGSKCSTYLDAVVPRVLLLLTHSAPKDSPYPGAFGQLQQQVMQRLADIVSIAGHSYLPYAFDTVLLVWRYLHTFKNSPACMTSVCSLLAKLRVAVGENFRPVMATILPPLLWALAEDSASDGIITGAILRALESFGVLLEEYREITLVILTKVATTGSSTTIQEDVLRTLVHLLNDMQSPDLLSSVIHPLLPVLAGISEESFLRTNVKQPRNIRNPFQESFPKSTSENKLPVLAAIALRVIGARAGKDFEVFVPVISKALRASDVKQQNPIVYRLLKELLLRCSPIVAGELLPGDLDAERGTGLFASTDLDEMQGSVQQLGYDGMNGFSNLSAGTVLFGPTGAPEPLRPHSTRVHVTEHELAAKWDVSLNSRPEDWINWMDALGATMFQQSGSPAFRGCGRIAELYPPFTKQLFNAAFLSCWGTELSDPIRSKISDSLDKALSSHTIPLNVLQAILNLFEYMDHDEKPLPACSEKLAPTACKCGAFAKAIRYREQDYAQHLGRPELLREDIYGEDGLISIYEKLGHIESAVGTVSHYQEHTYDNVQEQWLEKLQRWDEALAVYERTNIYVTDVNRAFPNGVTAGEALYADKHKWGHVLGRLRCLNELGEWRQMNDLLQLTRTACEGNIDALRQLALEGKGASVAFDLGRWDEFEEWVSFMSPDSYDGCFYSTLLSVKRGKDNPIFLGEAEKYLYQARCKLDLELIARVSEAYPRAYAHVVNTQLLVELEEMIAYLRRPQHELLNYGKKRLHDLWSERLKGCKQDRFTWYRLLMIRALVMKPVDTKDQWLEFATMCRKTNRLPMASEALRMLLTSFFQNNPSEVSYDVLSSAATVPWCQLDEWDTTSIMKIAELDIKFACIKHMWAIDKRGEAYAALQDCRHEFWADSSGDCGAPGVTLAETIGPQDDRRILAGEVYSKLSKWGDRIVENGNEPGINPEYPLQYAERATKIRPDWYKAWHYWGTLNASRFEAIMEQEKMLITAGNDPSKKAWHVTKDIPALRRGKAGRAYLMEAVNGYFRAIDLEGKTRLEDTLKILTLWFNYGGYSSLHTEFDKFFKYTNIAMWLEVVPQIIARLYSPVPGVQRGVKALLTRIGREHPQVAVYPLTVARSAVGPRQEKRRHAAAEILDELRNDHPEIVEQSELVARELIRSAILWTEMWYERLEEASKLYFVEGNIDGMLDTLLPLHADMEQGAETVCEEEFIREFGEPLREAGDCCRRFRAGHGNGENESVLREYLLHAWAIYHSVFRKMHRQQQSMLAFDMNKVTNGLHAARDLKLAVPGTYHPDQGTVEVVAIQAFGSELKVVQSKQRPRRISITGTDGRQYQFLLKGHEDLRQDERVMQVFGLINKLFAKSGRRDILNGVEMKTYAVIALSSNAGLIEWVPDCDTMHALVKEYREVRNILPNIEHKVMLRIAPEPDRLPLLHKIDLFEFMLQNTVSVDIAKVLWLKSRNSEMWLERRNTYARSLATTSMAGYLLGLGDRHPSNLMIERSTGKVLHIDFGDCFEVAMKREKYPEKVPFRLTRMLVQALEPCGVDGYFRHTAEATMDVLRQKNARESLMAMMEAFVYDPLIRWKLIGAEELIQIREEQAANLENAEKGRQTAMSDPVSRFTTSTLTNMDPNVRSLRETGSLAASVRHMERQERRSQAQNTAESPVGAMPTPTAATHEDEEDIMDPAEWQTPNEKARMEQMRALRDGDPTHQLIANVSNEKAQVALNRFVDKLCGTDFDPDVSLQVSEQVRLLIQDAQNIEHLCALFMGWCAFW